MKKKANTTQIGKIVWSLLFLSGLFIFSGCDSKKSSRDSTSGSVYQQCASCPIQTDVLARGWGKARDQYRDLEMGLHFYIDLEKYNVGDYQTPTGQYRGNFQGEKVWAEGYMYVDADRNPYCSMAHGFYDVRTLVPAQLNYNGFYTMYGSGANVTGLRLEAIHRDTGEVVELNWDNAQFSTLNPYIISDIDGVEYQNGIEAFIYIDRIVSNSGSSCEPNRIY